MIRPWSAKAEARSFARASDQSGAAAAPAHQRRASPAEFCGSGCVTCRVYGWPRTGLIRDPRLPRFGSGELYLLLPALAALTRYRGGHAGACGLPHPLMPFAPALVSQGHRARSGGGGWVARGPLWALEQVARLGRLLTWPWRWARRPQARRNPPFATRRPSGGRTLGVLFRPRRAAREASAAVLRLSLQPISAGGAHHALEGPGCHAAGRGRIS